MNDENQEQQNLVQATPVEPTQSNPPETEGQEGQDSQELPTAEPQLEGSPSTEVSPEQPSDVSESERTGAVARNIGQLPIQSDQPSE
jgi:hypothetical protein